MSQQSIKIGTRGSQLALYQANYIKDLLESTFPKLQVTLVIIKTKGDKILDTALSKIGDKGLFTKELEVALLNNEVDVAVHSLKDMPTELPEGLKLGAVVERGDIADALVSKNHIPLKELTKNHKIATSSLRRKANLLHHNPSLQIVDIRGNVNSRLQKMEDGHCDAMIMAAAGLKRLGLEKYITEILPVNTFIPAVSQGAIGIESRENDEATDAVLKAITHQLTWQAVSAERAFMNTLEGGCQVPVGCVSTIKDKELKLKGFVASVDGSTYLCEEFTGSLENAVEAGKTLAEMLIEQGGANILKEIRLPE